MKYEKLISSSNPFSSNIKKFLNDYTLHDGTFDSFQYMGNVIHLEFTPDSHWNKFFNDQNITILFEIKNPELVEFSGEEATNIVLDINAEEKTLTIETIGQKIQIYPTNDVKIWLINDNNTLIKN